MPDFIASLLEHLGYAEVFFLMVLENIIPPIPSELIMPLAGYRVADGALSFWPVVLLGTAGSVTGQTFWYMMARLLGYARLRAFIERYGRFLGVKGADLDPADRWFAKYGGYAVFFGRLIPAIRTLISVPAGVFAMPLRQFLALSLLGSGLWVLFLTYLGMKMGENHGAIAEAMAPFGKIAVFGVGAVLLFLFLRLKRRQRLAKKP